MVLAQLEGSGRRALGAYDATAASDLHHFLQDVPMRDGDEWLAQLMRQNTSLGGFVSSRPRKKGFDKLQDMSLGEITYLIPITKIGPETIP